MRVLKYILAILFMAIVSCDLPSEYTEYHWAEHWIAVMDANGQNIKYIHKTIGSNSSSEFLMSFRRDGALKLLDMDHRSIVVLDSNGENAVKLAENTDFVGICSVSYDGQYVLFTAQGNIYKAATDGSGTVALTQDSGYFDQYPQFARYSTEIVFVRKWIKSTKAAIMVLNENGDRLTEITNNFNDPSKIKSFSYPAFDGGEQYIYYNYYNGGTGSGLYRIKRDGSAKELIFSSEGLGNPIEVSTAVIGFAFRGELFVFDPVAGDVTSLGQVFNTGRVPYRFRFSADGQYVILATGDYYGSQIIRIQMASKEKTVIGVGWSPSYLPDGRILFIANRWFESRNQNDVPYDTVY